MLNFKTTNQFEKDFKRVLKRGKDKKKIKDVMAKLIKKQPLDAKHKDHNLTGNYVGRCECHIEPDWLLIYQPKYGSWPQTNTDKTLSNKHLNRISSSPKR